MHMTSLDVDVLAVLVDNAKAAKNALALAQETSRKAQSMLIEAMKVQEVISVDSETYHATLVEPETTEFDEVTLHKDIGTRAFNKYCRKEFVPAKVKAAVASGDLDADFVAKYVVIKRKEPYVLITEIRDGE